MEIIPDEESGRYGPKEGDVRREASIDEALLPHREEFDIDEDASLRTSQLVRGHDSRTCFPQFASSVVTWVKGPQPPQVQAIKPWFPSIQSAPLCMLEICHAGTKSKLVLLLLVCICWAVVFGALMMSSASSGEIEGFGMPVRIRCVDTLWLAGNGCGLDGIDCRPFNGSSLAFRCPANCAGVQVLNPRAVGAQEIMYRPFVIGGPVYRGDSFICGAAIHAGVVNNDEGGCGVLSRVGQRRDFPASEGHGITSIEFDSHFPLSFTFLPTSCKAKELRWQLLGVSIAFTVLVSVFTTSASVLFFTSFIVIFAHVGLVSDPPSILRRDELLSNIIGKFLPVAFCAIIIYRSCVKLSGLMAQIEKTVLWLGGCWLGALSNYTLDWIPISRLTSHDLDQQPGAKLALAMVILLLVSIAAQQIYYFRLEGRLPRYLALYSTFIIGILLLLAVPGFNLRIHHYVLALLFLPGTSLQTRPSLLYQGILLGLFINGIARWGFDPILQTNWALRDDGQFGSLLPKIVEPVISIGSKPNITFSWEMPDSDQFDGISVLVNDVERFRSYVDESGNNTFTWNRDGAGPEYFRFGFVQGANSLDYTKAGVWDQTNSWIDMEPGPSRT